MKSRAESVVRWLASILAAFSLALGGVAFSGAAPALAYEACQTTSSVTTSTTTGSGGTTVTVTATFRDCNGRPVSGVRAAFSQLSGPPGCALTFNPQSGITDANGQITATVTLPLNCPGNYVIGVNGANVQLQITIRELGGFPNTGSGPVSAQRTSLVPIGVLLLGLLFVALGVGGLAMRRSR